mmetsp:Transcript_8912/g.9262  ORF Transcript_8912/g.9262 Transcript_8912/m.9262 type:complete len:148 (-) Transcript_8912:67-510(-)|eukprot:CAMPEP_0170526120 /NCGR_PEP_ID=MMETSP0209-20121228/11586_1 /TAXON_ID=665100 ORGANISM="Litonotus pictus, Strain P1" /NCGR_SAMPLE_ID=MMETSP0209 /ASSEMBLY_ACC=CAM_ASM_000301 /LENGTH=147 /DNA_ID=CAMNT_0010815803 /DNA_START=45 /DNA_END=488 /DNA_ORIENTATION=-
MAPKGKTNKDKDKDKKKGETKKKPTMKDILAKKKGAGGKKKKWSKTKTKEKLNNSVFWTKSAWDKVNKDIAAKEAYLSPSVLSEKLKINVSLARAAIQQLIADEKIMAHNNDPHSKWSVYVKTEKFTKEVEARPVEATKEKKQKGKK